MAEKVVVEKESGEIVGRLFKICKDCGRMLSCDYEGDDCPDCDGELEETGVIGLR